jgi:hypothetical protein
LRPGLGNWGGRCGLRNGHARFSLGYRRFRNCRFVLGKLFGLALRGEPLFAATAWPAIAAVTAISVPPLTAHGLFFGDVNVVM